MCVVCVICVICVMCGMCGMSSVSVCGVSEVCWEGDGVGSVGCVMERRSLGMINRRTRALWCCDTKL